MASNLGNDLQSNSFSFGILSDHKLHSPPIINVSSIESNFIGMGENYKLSLNLSTQFHNQNNNVK